MYLGCIKHKSDQRTIASISKANILRISQTYIDDFGFERVSTLSLIGHDLPKIKKFIEAYEEHLGKLG